MSSPRITRALLSESIRSKDDTALTSLLPSVTSDQINLAMEEDGNTLLHVACLHNNANAAEELVKMEGVDINAANNDGETPVVVAISWLHQEVLRVLLKDLRVDIGDLEEHVGKCVEGEEDAKEEVKMMVEEERMRRGEKMQEKQEGEEGVQKRGIKEMGVREYAREKKEHVKAKLDPAHVKAKLDPAHVKAKLDPAHVKAKLDPAHVKAKLDPAHVKTKHDPAHVKAKLDPAHVKAKLDPVHVKAKLDPVHVKAKLDEKKDFAKTKLENLKQKIGAKTAGAQEQE